MVSLPKDKYIQLMALGNCTSVLHKNNTTKMMPHLSHIRRAYGSGKQKIPTMNTMKQESFYLLFSII